MSSFEEKIKEYGVLVSLDSSGMVFADEEKRKIYWNTQLKRIKDLIGTHPTLDILTPCQDMEKDIKKHMKVNKIPIENSFVDQSMFIAPDAYISTINGVSGEYKKYEKEYKEWIGRVKGTDYFLALKKVDIIFNIAEKLHTDLIVADSSPIPGPVQWLENQDYMRQSWERYTEKLKTKTEAIQKKVMEGLFYKYSIFMYEKFPSTFGKKMKECGDRACAFL